jgi:hypothetical protein
VDTEQVEVKNVSDEARILSFLRDVKEAHPGKTEMMIQAAEWLHDFPDIELLLSSASEQGLIDAFPRRELGQNEREEWNYWDVTLRPKLVKILKGQPREVRRQVTIAGKHVDVRNGINQEIMQADADSLNTILVPWWIKNLQDPQSRKRNASERALQKVVALRLHDISEENIIKIRELARQPVESIVGEGV